MPSAVHPLLDQLLKAHGVHHLLQPAKAGDTGTRRPRLTLEQINPLLTSLDTNSLLTLTEKLISSVNNELNQLAPVTPKGADGATPLVLGEYNDLGPLAQQFALHKFAFDQHAIISVTDKVGRIIYVNQQFCDRSGYSQQELLGSFHRFAQSREYPNDYYQSMWATVKQGNTWQGEIKNLPRTGETYWVFATIVPILDREGVPVQFISVRTDITDRKMIARQLEKERQFFDHLADTVGDGIFATNEAGECIFFNVEAERILGWKRQEMLGKCVKKQVFAPQTDAITQAVNAGLARPKDTFMAQSDGTAIAVDIRTSALSWSRNSTGTVTVFRDITLTRKAELEREKALQKAEKATKAKSQFLANMSHEIRTPMNAIIGMSYLALDTPLDKQQNHYLSSIQHSAHNLLGIINDILDFSRIEAGQLKIESAPFSLDAVLDEIFELNQVKAQEKAIDFHVTRDFDIPDELIGDSLRLNQILTNLVSNAVKFTHQGSVTLKISLEADAPNDQYTHLTFTIRDTGIGINEAYLKQLFTPFSQADTSTTRQYGGTGLGLTISQQLISLLGGHIKVTSQVGRGSCFSVHLPFKPLCRVNAPLPATAATKAQLLTLSHKAPSTNVLLAYHQHGIQNQYVTPKDLKQWHANKLEHIQGIVLDQSINNEEALICAMRHAPLLSTPCTLIFDKASVTQTLPNANGLSLFTPKNVARQLAHALNHDDLRQQKSLSSQLLCLSTTLPPSRILLVEDNALNVEVAKAMLETLGMTVICAYDGFEAVETFQKTSIDLILMDLQMPQLDGFAASAQIRNLSGGEDIPIIALTAHAMSGDKEKSLSHGMNDHLVKPIDPKLLQACLASWLPINSQPPSLPSQPQQTSHTMSIETLAHLAPHLDVKEGLYRTGDNLALYRSLLTRFINTHKTSGQLLMQHCEQQAFEQGSLLIHTVKGVAGNLGAKQLFGCTANLETLLSQQTLPTYAQLESYKDELKLVCEAMHEALEVFDVALYSEEDEQPPITAPKLKVLLNDLKVLADCGDVECLNYIDYLRHYEQHSAPALSQPLAQLISLIEEFDFEHAEAEISSLLANSALISDQQDAI